MVTVIVVVALALTTRLPLIIHPNLKCDFIIFKYVDMFTVYNYVFEIKMKMKTSATATVDKMTNEFIWRISLEHSIIKIILKFERM